MFLFGIGKGYALNVCTKLVDNLEQKKKKKKKKLMLFVLIVMKIYLRELNFVF